MKSTTELARPRIPAPWLGQHSAEVLKSLGRSDEEINALFNEGVVFDKYREKATA